MIEQQTTIPVEIGKLIGQVENLRNLGYRLVQISCTKIGDAFEINYSFDKAYEFRNLKVAVAIETEIPSITGMYWGAFIYENEMHDLFGLQIRGMNIDYKGNLIRTTVKYPFGMPVSSPKEERE
jgi:ech hydrogenase subunit D